MGHRDSVAQGPRPMICLPMDIFSLFCCTNRFGTIVFDGEDTPPPYLMSYLLNTLVKMFPEKVSMADALHALIKNP